MKKMIALDLDNTLLNNQKEISKNDKNNKSLIKSIIKGMINMAMMPSIKIREWAAAMVKVDLAEVVSGILVISLKHSSPAEWVAWVASNAMVLSKGTIYVST